MIYTRLIGTVIRYLVLVASRNLKAARILESAANGEGEEEPVPVVPTDGQRGSKVWNQPTYPPELPAAPAPPYIPPPVLGRYRYHKLCLGPVLVLDVPTGR